MKDKNSKIIKRNNWKKALSFLIITCLIIFSSVSSFALPEGQQVESGNATFEYPDANTLKIIAGDKAVINFNSFNIGQNEAVQFIQPSQNASVLSRVIGSNASEIYGSLIANGTLILTNPAGIYFAPSANVQVNNMMASTLDISTQNFLKSNYVFAHNPEAVFAQILNEGYIGGNNIALIASAVDNSGVIAAKTGTVSLASGDKATVSFDAKGMIQVEVNEKTSGKVKDIRGNDVKSAVSNTGKIEGGMILVTAQTAKDIFENAVNTQGVFQSSGLTEKDGVIRIVSNEKIQLSGILKAKGGFIEICTAAFIAITSEFFTIGNTEISADNDIMVKADVTTDSGNLSFKADKDLDGQGAFKQAKNTTVKTVNSGDIAIQASGESTLANISSAGSLSLKKSGTEAVFIQHPDSSITTKGSLNIDSGVTLSAANSVYDIGKDWINLGNFIPSLSTVFLSSPLTAKVVGENVFYNFTISTPGKIVGFDPVRTQAILGTLTLRGEYGKLLVLGSLEAPKQWRINPQGPVDISYALLGDCINIRGPPLKATHTSSLGNNTNWDLDPFWTGQGATSNWSDADNWDTGTVPTAFDIITFDGITGLNPQKDSFIDPAFQGTIANLTLNGYTGTLSLGRDLTISGNLTLASGSFQAGNFTINIAGNWDNQGGNFQAQTSTVNFIDSSKTSSISGNSIFYDLSCFAEDKNIIFADQSLTQINHKLDISTTGMVTINGTIDASVQEPGMDAKDIEIRANWIYLDGTVKADAVIGKAGNIDFYAYEALMITPGSLVSASVTLEGDGGNILVYSPKTAIFMSGASIQAKGGNLAGNGGFVEVSGKEYVEITGEVDLTAPNGVMGTFLIDPYDVYITADSDARGSWDEGDPNTWVPSGSDSNVSVSSLGNSNVKITTTGAGAQLGDIYVDVMIFYSTGYSLELVADRNIIISAVIDLSGAIGSPGEGASGGALILTAGGDIIINADIYTVGGTNWSDGMSGGAVTIHSTGGDISISGGIYTTGGASASDYEFCGGGFGGNVSITADNGSVSVGAITTDGGAAQGIAWGNGGDAGSITISATTGITLNGSFSAQGGAASPDVHSIQGNGGGIDVSCTGGLPSIILGASITMDTTGTNGGNITINSPTVFDSLTGAEGLFLNAKDGAVTLNTEIGIYSGYFESLTVITSGVLTLGGSIDVYNNADFSQATGDIILADNYDMGIYSYNGSIDLSGSTVNAASAGVQGLYLNAGFGSITLAGIGLNSALEFLTVVTSGTLTLDGAITTEGGNVDLSGVSTAILIENAINTNGGDFIAPGDNFTSTAAGTITTLGGNVDLTAFVGGGVFICTIGGDIDTTGASDTPGGSVSIGSDSFAGDIYIDADITARGGTASANMPGQAGGIVTIQETASDSITILGVIDTRGSAGNDAGAGAQTGGAGGNVILTNSMPSQVSNIITSGGAASAVSGNANGGNAGNVTIGGGVWTLNGDITVQGGAAAGAGTQGNGGTLVFTTSNTFNDVSLIGPKTITFTSGTTQTINNDFVISGVFGTVITLNSSTPGSPATLSKTTGQVDMQWMSIQDITATGGAVWIAQFSTSVSGNTGITFPPYKRLSNAGGNFSDGATWDGGVAPSNNDDIYADASSGNLIIDIAFSSVRSFDFTNYVGMLTLTQGLYIIGQSNQSVRCKFGSGMTIAGANNIKFDVIVAGTLDIYTNGLNIPNSIIINPTSTNSTINLRDNLTMGSSATLTHTAGTFNTNGFTVNIGKFASSNSNTRVINLGASVITITGVSSTVWDFVTATNLTFNAGTSSIVFTGTSAVMYGSNKTFYDVSFTGGGSIGIYGGSRTYNTLTITGTDSKTDSVQLSVGGTQTTTTLNITGNSVVNRLLIASYTLGNITRFSATNVNISNVDFRDVVGLGTAAPFTGTSLGDCGGNTGITFTGSQTNYWVGNGGNWSDINHWASTSGGEAASGRVPLPQDDVRFDANSFTSGSQTVTTDMPRLGKSIDWTGSANIPAWSLSTINVTSYGSITLINAMTLSSNKNYYLEGRGSYVFTSNENTFAPTVCYIQMVGGTLTLADDFIAENLILVLNNGTFDANDQDVTVQRFASSGSTTRAIDMGSGTWTLSYAGGATSAWDTSTATGLTFDAGTSAIVLSGTGASERQFKGGGLIFNNVSISSGGSGATTFTGSNTFNNFTINGPKTVTFTSGTTQTINGIFTALGSAGNIITLNASTLNSPATLSMASGVASCNYLSLTDITASGGASWYAGANSTVSNSSGWITRNARIISDAGGNWSSTSAWVEGAVPTSADDVFARSTSGNLTIDAAAACNAINLTGYTGILMHNAGITLSVGSAVGGNFIFPAAMTYTLSDPVTSAINFVSTTTGNNIYTGGKTLGNVTFNGAGGGWTLQDSFTNSSTASLILTQGSLNTNGQTINIGILSSSNTNARTLTLGASQITVSGRELGGGGASWTFDTPTNLTFDCGTSSITFTASSAYLKSGNKTFNNVIFQTLGTPTINGGTYANLTITGPASKTGEVQLIGGATITISGLFTFNGNSEINRLLIRSSVLGNRSTINAASISISNADFRDITGAGAANWNLSAIDGDSGDCGGNLGITFTSAVDQHWVSASGGNWSEAGNWTSRVPLPQDDVYFDNIFSANQTVTSDMPRLGKNIDWTGALGTPTWKLTTNDITSYGSITMIAGMAMSSDAVRSYNIQGRGSYSITSAGQRFANQMNFQAINGTYTLQDTFYTYNRIYLYNGTLTAVGNVSAYSMSVSGTSTRALNMGSGTWLVYGTSGTVWDATTTTNLTFNADNSTIAVQGSVGQSKTFVGGGLTYNNFSITGTGASMVILTGSNIFNDFKVNAPKTATFTSGTTQTINGVFTSLGTNGNVITINASTPGSAASISKSSGLIFIDYASIQDIAATGGATWYTGANVTQVSGCSGFSTAKVWDGGAGADTNWSTAANWTGDILPGSGDDVFFSGTTTDSIVDAGFSNSIKSLTLTSTYANTISNSAALTILNDVNVAAGTLSPGSQTINVGGSWMWTAGTFTAGTSTINMNATSAGETFTAGGQTYNNITFNGAGGGWTLQDGLTTGSSATLALVNGTFNTNSQTLSIGKFNTNYSGNTRSLTLGASVISITGGSALVWTTSTNSTGYTFDTGTSVITFTGASPEFLSATGPYNDVRFTGGGTITLRGTVLFNNLTVVGTDSKTDALKHGVISSPSFSVGNLTLQGNSSVNRLLVYNGVLGGEGNINVSGSITVSNVDFRDIKISGGSAPLIGTSVGDCGGNSGITFTSAQTNFWVGEGGNWSEENHWASTSGGAAASGRVPLPQDDVRFDANSFTLGSQTVATDMPRLGKNIDWTGAANNPVWNLQSSNNTIYGSLTLIPGMTTSFWYTTIFEGRGNYNLFSSEKIFNQITVQMIGGKLSLQDNFTQANSYITVSNGTFDANNFSVTAGAFYASGTSTINMGNGTWKMQSPQYYIWYIANTVTLNQGSSTLELAYTGASIQRFNSSKTYNNLIIDGGGAGVVTFSDSNTFNNFTINAPKTITFTSGTTQTILGTFTATGDASNAITLNSSSAGSSAVLSKSGPATVSCDYLALTDITATGGATWFAGANSGSGTRTAGWIFTAPAAQTRYWIVGDTQNWNYWSGASSYWAASTGGTAGASLPRSNDSVIFDGNGVGSCNINTAVSVAAFDMQSGYTGTVTINAGQSLTVSGGFSLASTSGAFNSNGQAFTIGSYSQSAGTFNSGASDIVINGDFNLSGGTFNGDNADITCVNMTANGSSARNLNLGNGTWTVSGNWDSSGTNQTIDPGQSTVDLINSGNVATKANTASPYDFYNLKCAYQNKITTLTSSIHISNLLTLSADGSSISGTITGGPHYLYLYRSDGDPILNNNNATISVNGVFYRPSSDITIAGHTFNSHVWISNYNSTTNITVTLSSDLSLVGNRWLQIFANYSNRLVTLNTNGSNITCSNLYLGYGSSIGGAINFGTGHDAGHVITGNLSRTPTYTSTSNAIDFGTSTVSVGGNIDFTGINVSHTGAANSTVIMNGASGIKTLTSAGQSFENLTFNDNSGSATYQLQDALDVNGDLTITGGTLDTKSGTNASINVAGSWANNDIFTANSGTVTFDATTIGKVLSGNMTGSNAFYAIVFNGIGGSWSLNNDLTATKPTAQGTSFTLTAGSFDANDKNLNLVDMIANGSSVRSLLFGNGTWTVSGSWDSSGTNQTINPEQSTVELTGTGNVSTKANTASPYDFYNLKVAYSTKITTILSDICLGNVLYLYQGGTINGTKILRLFKSDGDPLSNTGAVINTEVLYNPSADITVAGHTFANNVYYRPIIAKDIMITLSSDLVTTASVYIYNSINSNTVILNSDVHNIYCANLYLGHSSSTKGSINFNSGIHTILGDLKRRDTSVSTSNTIDFGTSTVSVGGNIDFTGINVSHTGASNSTVIMNGASGIKTLTSAGQAFENLTFNDNSGSATFQIVGDLNVDGNLNITDGIMDLVTSNPDPNVNVAGDVTIGSGALVNKGAGTWTFDGASQVYTDNTAATQDIGAVSIGPATTTSVSTASNVKFSSLTIGANDALNISGDTLTLTGTGTPLTITAGGTFTTTGSTVIYAGSGSATNITTTPYNNLTLTPTSATTYNLTGDLTGANALTGNLTINANATLDTRPVATDYDLSCVNLTNAGILDAASSASEFTVSGSWDATGGTFNAGSSTVTFTDTTGGKILSGNMTGSNAFYAIVFNGVGGSWSLNNDLTATKPTASGTSFTLTRGAFDANDKNLNLVDMIANGSLTRSLLLGNGTWTISGSWNSTGTNQTIDPEQSTVDLTESGSLRTKNNANSPYDFYNLKAAHDGKTVTMGSYVNVSNLLYVYSGGTLNGDQAMRLYKSDGDPLVNTGASWGITVLVYRPTSDISVAGYDFGDITVYYSSVTNDASITLTSDISAGAIAIYSITPSKTATLNTSISSINCSALTLGASSNLYGNINFGSGNHIISGSLQRGGTVNGLNLDFGTSTVSIGGNINFTGINVSHTGASNSTVIMNGASGIKTLTSAGQAFENLTFNDNSGFATFQIVGDLNVDGNLNITDGILDLVTSNPDPNVNVAGDVTIGSGASVNKGTGTWIFDGTGTSILTDNTSSGTDFGLVAINGSSKTLQLSSGVNTPTFTFSTLTIGSDDTLDLNGENANISSLANSNILALKGTEAVSITNMNASGSIKYYGSDSVVMPGISNYYNLLIQPVSGNPIFTTPGSITVAGDLDINSGTLALGNTHSLVTSGNISLNGGSLNASAGNIEARSSIFISNILSTLTAPGSGKNFTISGSFLKTAGNFDHNLGTLVFNDASKISNISGLIYNNLTCIVPAKQLVFSADETQIVIGSLTLKGEVGNLILLRSSLPGSQWKINAQGLRDVSYVDVKDSNNISSTSIIAVHSLNSGNNTNWTIYPGPVPPPPAPVNTPTLIQGESVLYRMSVMPVYMFTSGVSMMMPLSIGGAIAVPMPIALPMPVAGAGGGAAAALPVPKPGSVPAPASPKPLPKPSSESSEAQAIKEVSEEKSEDKALTLESFEGVSSVAGLPAQQSFEGINSQASLIGPVTLEAFKGASSSANLPVQQSFAGANSQVSLTEALTSEAFRGASSSAGLPLPHTFEGIHSQASLTEPLIPDNFKGASSVADLPVQQSFSGVNSKASLTMPLTPEVFKGVSSTAGLPVPRTFEGINSQVSLTGPITSEAFKGASSSAGLPASPSFAGVNSQSSLSGVSFNKAASEALMPQALTISNFQGAVSGVAFPEAVAKIKFEEAMNQVKTKVMLPNGASIVPTYSMGIPLGVEKSLIEPRIKSQENQDK